jgi:CheY-like chemotaxis protein
MLTAPSNTNASHKQRLLVGEKNPTLRSFLLSVFTAEGYDVVEAATGVDLLDAVTVSLHPEFGSGAFALVISETTLLCEAELQAFDRLGDWTSLPPFMFIATSLGDMALDARLEPFETIAVLEQPVDIASLRDRVNSFLHHPPRNHRSLQSASHG